MRTAKVRSSFGAHRAANDPAASLASFRYTTGLTSSKEVAVVIAQVDRSINRTKLFTYPRGNMKWGGRRRDTSRPPYIIYLLHHTTCIPYLVQTILRHHHDGAWTLLGTKTCLRPQS